MNRKIYYIANARMPTEKAHGIQLAKMCEAFIEQGITLELVVPRRKTIPVALKEFYGLRVGIPVRKIPVMDWYAKGRAGFFISSLIFACGYFFFLLRQRLRGETFLVYTTDIDQFSFFLIPFVGVPYFAEIHDAKPRRAAFVLLFSRAQGIIVINRIIKKELEDVFSLAPRAVMVRPNGIDLEMYQDMPARHDARHEFGMPKDKKIVMYAGKFYDWKGLDILIEAARSAPKEILFYAVGGTAEELTSAGGIAELPQNLICTGHRDFREIPRWLAAADVLLLLGTAQNDYSYLHTSPMKAFEYMASARPIVASHTPANCEILSGKEAFLYEPDNAAALAREIASALANPEECAQKVMAARERVHSFSWTLRAGSILSFIDTQLCASV